ncbi:uncharacterized protein TNCV_2100491 [Trichonephila clavipes]|nr:uncharacterized protein TNCV_2100491 [Trichonephila clavipes]
MWKGGSETGFSCVFCSSNDVLSSFASDLDTTQRKHLQNFSKSTETVFCQGPRIFGCLRHFQKERELIEDEPCSGRPSFSKTAENVVRVLCVQISVNRFLASKNISVAPQPPYSPNLSPCDFFLFPE